MSIRIKVILPYLLLTLVVAVTGVYVVTRLVANSLNERLTNQLLESGRVVSDGVARLEIKHLDVGRILVYTRGLAEALSNGDSSALSTLAKPVAGGLDAENLVIIDRRGHELLHLLRQPDGTVTQIDQDSGAGGLQIVQGLLKKNDPQALPGRILAQNPIDNRYYYYTAMPVPLGSEMAGVLLVGTSLNTALPYLKSISLSDVTFYVQDGKAIATTLGAKGENAQLLDSLSIPAGDFQQLMANGERVSGREFSVEGRLYSMAQGALQVGNERLGVFSVALPMNFVVQSMAVSRNTYILLYAIAMIGVVVIGYTISRLIINPLSSLVQTSQAIAGGDLDRRTNIHSSDEIGLLANTFDEMTARLKERTAELEDTYRILEQMDRTKTSFIEVSAHELRTPLTLIKGYTQMLQIKSGSDPELEILTRGIIDGTNRMSEIVNSMLDVSKIDNKTLQVVPESIQIGLLIVRVQKVFASALEERKQVLDTHGVNDLPPIYADPDLIYKVFYHLVMNAIKYTPDGGYITVSGRVIEDAPTKREVEIIVADTGVGIDSQYHELVFEKFFQTGEVQFHSSGKTKFKGGGPGLGLAIARGIVEAHGGRIWVESPRHDEQMCPGSRFYVRLPIGGERQK